MARIWQISFFAPNYNVSLKTEKKSPQGGLKKEKFKTQKPNWIEKIIIWLTSSKKKLHRIFARMAQVIQEEKIELVINDGDLMENPQNERGLITRKGIATAKQIMRSFCEKNHVRMELNAGNYEMAYWKNQQAFFHPSPFLFLILYIGKYKYKK